MTIGELVFNLGFKADTMKLKDFGRAVADLNLSSIISAGSFGAFIETAKKWIDIAHGMGDGLNKFSMETGKSSEELQRWVKVGEAAQVSGGVVESTIRGIATSMAMIRAGKPPSDANFWSILGLGPQLMSNKDPSQVFMAMLQRLKMLKTDQAMVMLQNYGKNVELLDIIKQFPDLQKAYNDQTVLSPKQLASINQNAVLFTQTSQDLNMIWATLGTSILPGVNQALIQINASLDTMSKSEIFKDLQWFIGNFVSGQLGMLGQVGKGLGLLVQAGNPNTWRDMGRADAELARLSTSIKEPVGSNNVTQHNQITVQGAHNAEATAKAIEEHLDKRIDHAIANGSTGGW